MDFRLKPRRHLLKQMIEHLQEAYARGQIRVVSTLFTESCLNRQENYAAISISFSTDAANITLKVFVNFIPLVVNRYLFCFGSLRMIP